jgi:hypothetical protein
MNDDLPIVAFPQTVGNEHCFGMMLRDYFAASSLTGTLCGGSFTDAERMERAKLAYKMADAMMEARK